MNFMEISKVIAH